MGETLATIMKIAIAAVIIVGLSVVGKTLYEKFKGNATTVGEFTVD